MYENFLMPITNKALKTPLDTQRFALKIKAFRLKEGGRLNY